MKRRPEGQKPHLNIRIVTVAIILIIGAAFVVGTFVGFRISMKQLESCREVPCETIGVQAERCEVCSGNGVLVRLMG